MGRILEQALGFDLLKVGHCRHLERVARRDGRWKIVSFPALVGLLAHPERGLVLFDTGYAPHFQEATRGCPACLYARLTPVALPPEETLEAQLASRGWTPSDIGTVVVSHFHADHIAGLRDLPGARIVACGDELARLRRLGGLARLRRGFLDALVPGDLDHRLGDVAACPEVDLPAELAPFRRAWDLLGDGSLLGLDLPGHTGSQLGVLFRSRDLGPVLLAADAAWSLGALRTGALPSWPARALFADGARYRQTFQGLADLMGRPGAPRLIPSHCQEAWEALGGRREVVRA